MQFCFGKLSQSTRVFCYTYVCMYMCITTTVHAHMYLHWRYLFLLCFQSAALSYDMCRERLKAKNLMYVMQILQILEGFLKFLKCEHYTCHSNSWAVPTHLLMLIASPFLWTHENESSKWSNVRTYIHQFVQYVCTPLCTFVSGTMNIINIGRTCKCQDWRY